MDTLFSCCLVSLFTLINFQDQSVNAICQDEVDSKRIKRQVDDEETAEQYYGSVRDNWDNDDVMQSRFVGGQEVFNGKDQAPFLAILYRFGGNNEYNQTFLCTGTFIAPKVILTAAHCFGTDFNPKNYFIRFRTGDEKDLIDLLTNRIKVAGIVPHDVYEQSMKDGSVSFDIAIVITVCEHDYLFSWDFARLPLENSGNQHMHPEKLEIFTFAPCNNYRSELNLRVAKGFLFPGTGCPGVNQDDEKFLLCAPVDKLSPCSGDSGAPFILREMRQKTIIGMIGKVSNDPKTNPTRMIRIWAHTKWILNEMRERNVAVGTRGTTQIDAYLSWNVRWLKENKDEVCKPLDKVPDEFYEQAMECERKVVNDSSSRSLFRQKVPFFSPEEEAAMTSRMAKGTLETPENVPFAASIMHKRKTDRVLCSGSFITPHIVITAAHCFTQIEDAIWYYVRYDTPRPLQEEGKNVAIKKILVHPRYRCEPVGTESPDGRFDIAILVLKCAASIKREQCLSLPLPCHLEMFVDNPASSSVVTLVSSGGSDTMEDSFILKRQQAYLFTTSCPHESYNSRYNFCNWKQDPLYTCPGDSGGPYFGVDSGKKILVAIHCQSKSKRSADGKCPLDTTHDSQLSMQVNVLAHMKWILQTMQREVPWQDEQLKELYKAWKINIIEDR